jgi:Tfp pilus assembly protein PilZ
MQENLIISDQREFERIGVLAIAHLKPVTKIEKLSPAKIFNISKGGMYLEADEKLEVGGTVYIWVASPLPGVSDKQEFFGQVQWKKALIDPYSSLYGYGIQFLE